MSEELASNLAKILPVPAILDVEQALIGGLLVEGWRFPEVASLVGVEDFSQKALKLVWETIAESFEAGIEPDLLTIHAALRAKDLLEPTAATMAAWAEGSFSGNLRNYAELVRDQALLRKVRSNIIDYYDLKPGIHHQDKLIGLIEGLTGALISESEAPRLLADGIHESLKRIDNRVDNAVPLVFDGLDDFFFCKRGDVIIVAGRPSMGKSAFLMQTLLGVTAYDQTALLFLLEDSAPAFHNRVLSHLAGVDNFRLQSGIIFDREYAQLAHVYGKVADRKLQILDAEYEWERIKAQIHHAKLKWPDLAMIGLDYLQLIEVRGREDRWEKIGRVTREAKMLAKRLDVAIVFLAQLSREVEKRQDKHPQLSDLRESGNIEQDADQVVFLYRQKYYDHTLEDLAEIEVAKMRNGRIGVRNMQYDAPHLKFLPEKGWVPPVKQGDLLQ